MEEELLVRKNVRKFVEARPRSIASTTMAPSRWIYPRDREPGLPGANSSRLRLRGMGAVAYGPRWWRSSAATLASAASPASRARSRCTRSNFTGSEEQKQKRAPKMHWHRASAAWTTGRFRPIRRAETPRRPSALAASRSTRQALITNGTYRRPAVAGPLHYRRRDRHRRQRARILPARRRSGTVGRSARASSPSSLETGVVPESAILPNVKGGHEGPLSLAGALRDPAGASSARR